MSDAYTDIVLPLMRWMRTNTTLLKWTDEEKKSFENELTKIAQGVVEVNSEKLKRVRDLFEQKIQIIQRMNQIDMELRRETTPN